MKKLLKLYSLTLALGLSYSVANAQTTNNEGAARMPETEATTIIVETEKKATIVPKENNIVVSENKVRPAKTVETNTEVLEFKNLNTTKKIVKGDRIKKHLKPEKVEKTNVETKLLLLILLITLAVVLIFLIPGLGIALLIAGIIVLILVLAEVI